MDAERNPYAPGAGRRPKALVGRDKQMEAFRVACARIDRGDDARSMVLDGLRGVGKTVLLEVFRASALQNDWITSDIHECERDDAITSVIAKRCYHALNSLEPEKKATEKFRRAFGVLRSFVQAGYVTLETDGSLRFGLDVEDVPDRANSGDPEEDLTDLLDNVGEAAREHGKGILLLMDEMQALSPQDLSLLSKVMHKVSRRKMPVLMVGAGLPQVPLLLMRQKGYTERLFDYHTIGALTKEQATDALVLPALRENVTYEHEAIKYILFHTKGYPYFLQQWGETVWDRATANPITLGAVGTAEKHVAAELNKRFFFDRYRTATEAERTYLHAMTWLGTGAYEGSESIGHTHTEVAEFLHRTPKALSMNRNALLRKGLIHGEPDGKLYFSVPGFNEYLKFREAQIEGIPKAIEEALDSNSSGFSRGRPRKAEN